MSYQFNKIILLFRKASLIFSSIYHPSIIIHFGLVSLTLCRFYEKNKRSERRKKVST